MSAGFIDAKPTLSWRFPATFWFANAAELFERAAFYGMFIALTLYLTRKIGFSDVGAGYLAAAFSSIIYLLPTFLGAMADKIGFRRALIVAFSLLSAGYALLGAFQYKSTAVIALGLIMFGGAIVKPVISGTVSKCSDEDHRARAFSIFYLVVNIGAFFGKTVAKPLRTGVVLPYVGRLELGLEYINFYASAMAIVALLFVLLFYRNVDTAGMGKSPREALDGLLRVIRNFRFMGLILIVAGFWTIQGQLYATMPKYLTRLIGESASPEWLANINPLVVVICVVPITHLVRHFKPENAIAIGLFIIPLSALAISLSPVLRSATGESVHIIGEFALHPITVMVIVGIGLQGLAECFLSPKFLEYASKQAPRGEEGLYLGYQHLTTFVAWALGFVISGHLIHHYCPDPARKSPEWRQTWFRATDTGYRFGLGPSVAPELQPGSPAPAAVLEAFAEERIGFAGLARIRGARLDGSDPATLVSIGAAGTHGLAVDPSTGRIYWTDYDTDTICRLDSDAGRMRVLIGKGLDCPKGVAVDQDAGMIYWADAGAGAIYRAKLDGSGVRVVLDKELRTPTEIAIDPAAGKIYWADNGTNSIQRANLDGSDVEDVVDAGLRLVSGIALDSAGERIYWSDAGSGKVQRATMDGSDVRTLVSSDTGSPSGIALDARGGHVYWSDDRLNKIQRCGLDGEDAKDVVVELISPHALTMDPAGKRLVWVDFSAPVVQAGDGGESWILETTRGEYRIATEGSELNVYKVHAELPAEYAHAHRIWYVFCAIGAAAFVAMLGYKSLTGRIDARHGEIEA